MGDNDSSSIELVYEENLSPKPKIKEEKDDDEEEEDKGEVEAPEEEECVVIEENENNENFNQDKDPMDLLELLDTKSHEDEDPKEASDNEDESESVASSGPNDRLISKLMKEFDWCFGDAVNNTMWCLFCNYTLKYPATYGLSKHQLSHNHRERTEEYLAFLHQLNKDTYRLLSNRDFDGDLNDAKNHRHSLDEDFSNYLWDKWEEDHDWLVRTEVRFFAYCKYCHHKINVANGYMRKQHEDGVKHKEFKSKAPKRRATVCGDLQDFQIESLTSEADSQETEADDGMVDKESSGQWYEKSKTSSNLCRCKLCDITMFQKSFRKHISSNLHRQNLSAFDNPGVSDKLVKPDWATIQKDHEWLIEDPIDPMEGYCKYCKKRLAYGSSAAKRLIHEHSSGHRVAVQNFNNPVTKTENPSEDGNSKKDEDTDNDDGNEKDEQKENSASEMSNDSEESQKKIKRRRAKRINIFEAWPWAKIYKKDSRYLICQYCKILLRKEGFYGKKHEGSTRHQQSEKAYLDKLGSKLLSDKSNRTSDSYPWLVKFKDGIDYVFCTYCNFRFSRKANKLHHQKTRRHQEAEKAILDELARKSEKEASAKTPAQNTKNDSREPKSPMATQAELKIMKANITEWQKRFTWLRFNKGLLLNYGFCVYCDKSVYMPTPTYASKHQRSSPHMRYRAELKRKEKLEESKNDPTHAEESRSENSSTTSAGQAVKRLKASSLQTAIETAKRLTAAHLEMMSFMHNNGQKQTDLIKTMQLTSAAVQEISVVKPMPPPPSSPSVDSITTTPINRDPFDLFFNSMSETLKRLPADLASEGKLKVMQIIFDLEIRAQQRQNPPEIIRTQNTSLNGSISNTTNDNSLNNLMDIDTPVETEIVISDEIPQQYQQQKQQQQQQRQQHQHARSHGVYKISTPNQQRTLLQQQLLQPHQPPPQQKQQSLVLTTLLNTSSPDGQMNTLPQRQHNTNIGGVQSPQLQSIYNQQRRSNPSYNNISQRFNANNTSITFTATTPSTSTSSSTLKRHLNTNHGTLINNARTNNVHSSPNKMPMIRPVPISSLTVKKYSNNDEPAFHHIQLNSSTQSKIIPLDTKKGVPR